MPLGEVLNFGHENSYICLGTGQIKSVLDLVLSKTTKVNTILDVLLNGTREESWLLRNDGQLGLMEPLVIDLLDFLVTVEEFALLWVVEPLNQFHDG